MTLTLNNMPAHNHVATLTNVQATPAASTAGATTNIPGPSLVPAVLPKIGSGPGAMEIKGYAPADDTTTMAATAVTGSVTVQPNGSGLPFSVENPYLALNYIIALEGTFPSRN